MILVIGDYYSGTGPALVTKYYIKALPEGTLYIHAKNKAARFFELCLKIPRASVLFISGHSRQNILAMRLGKLFGKKSAYLMHGAVEYENEINQVPDEKMASDERKMMKETDLILAVSRQFEEWLKDRYPQYKDKISHVTNGIDWDIITEHSTDDERDPKGIITVGGGMPRKRILNICKAVQMLNDRGCSITLTVAGDKGADSEAIASYPFVRDLGIIPHNELMREYHSNKIFIQASVFETFGLAPVEALLSDADVLISSRCGALSVIKNTEPSDIISDPEDIEEIAAKIENLLGSDNHTRLIVNLDKENTSWKKRASELLQKLQELQKKH
ncbi:MAG: glycosyltransferase family 4 protein [Lachnospiraceae bacterium]|nr:glycosyltransferase family 4 protein [Lachnospiraceae bacterium]